MADGYLPMKAPPMDRRGTRIYCHDMNAQQQKWAIDMLRQRVALTIPSTVGLLIADVVVRSTKEDRAILDIKSIRVPSDDELSEFKKFNQHE